MPMDVDGFDPYEDYWRDDLEVMGEQFQSRLKEIGVKRQFWRERKEERVKEISSELQQLLDKSLAPASGTVVMGTDGVPRMYDNGEWKRLDERAPDEFPREMVECPACHGQGGVPMYQGNPSNGPDYEICDDCRGTGEIPAEVKPPRTFRFTGF
jgi:RecJ-like exonuclease